ncbi:hypothetical protein ACMTAU_12730, partial [Alcaligenes pakistanensis]
MFSGRITGLIGASMGG